MLKKFLSVILIVTFIFSSIPAQPSLAATKKLNDWPLMKNAIQYDTEKNYGKAIYYWEELVKLYANYTTTYAYENGGHFAMKAGNYYSGLLDTKVFDQEKSTYYYEKAYNSYLKFDEMTGAKNSWAFITAKKRLDEVKTTIDLYIEKKVVSTDNKKALAKHEPLSGMYIGIYGEMNPDLRNGHYMDSELIKELYGKDHASVLYYNDFGVTPFPTEVAIRMKKIKGSIQIHMQPSKGLNSVVDGEYIRNFAMEAKSSGIPIFLRFGGEMNGDWVKWGLQPEKFIEKFRLIHDIMEKEAPNVAMVWAPNFFPWDNMKDYYPGDKYVDWVGVSCYTTLNYDKNTKESKLKANPIDLLQYIVKDYGNKKPIMIVEGAASKYAALEPNIDYSQWASNNIRKFYSYIPLIYPEIKAMYYFDSLSQTEHKANNKSLKITEFMLSDSVAVHDTYKEVINGDYYLSNTSTSSKIKYEKVSNTIDKNKVNLSTYIKIHDPNVSKVEYYIDNKLSHTSKSIPYNFSYDFSKYTAKTTKLTVKVYNSTGKLAEAKDYTLNLK